MRAAVLIAVSTGALAQSPPKPAHVGAYLPNSQLLTWCTSGDPADFRGCHAYIEGVINFSGNTDVNGKSGPISIPIGTPPLDPINAVVKYIQQLDPNLMSSPASESVYSALIIKYSYRNAVSP